MSLTAYMLALDGYADWEPALAIAEINKSDRYELRTVSLSSEPIRSMGGVRILPDLALDQLPPGGACLFIVPGGEIWEKEDLPEVIQFLRQIQSDGVPVAGICGGTIALARAGLLEGRRHTSNAPGYLEAFVPGYGDPAQYVDAPAVQDRGVISASGVGSVEFAYEIIRLLGLYPEEDQPVWMRLFRDKILP